MTPDQKILTFFAVGFTLLFGMIWLATRKPSSRRASSSGGIPARMSEQDAVQAANDAAVCTMSIDVTHH
ncbi:hypothetical protein G3A43_09130 [Paraburkholderia aspalathi]|nr:hypothetical protein [Paraburkholderia aspalathi]MBK3780403.1 hypothetical protein [Paraburkholderia aspalathi]